MGSLIDMKDKHLSSLLMYFNYFHYNNLAITYKRPPKLQNLTPLLARFQGTKIGYKKGRISRFSLYAYKGVQNNL